MGRKSCHAYACWEGGRSCLVGLLECSDDGDEQITYNT
jgi:hypothetical protein